MESSNSNGVITVRKQQEGMRIGNPFTLKVGQVFTGFGIGCGLGIGIGRPLNLGAIPVLSQVMAATSGATDALSSVGGHANTYLTKFGAKNIQAGIGCGVGFGHGFGVGLAVKPGVVHQIQAGFIQVMTKVMTKFGVAPNLSSVGHSILPASLQSGLTNINDRPNRNPVGNILQLATRVADPTSQTQPQVGNSNTISPFGTSVSKSPPLNTSYGSRTEKVLNSFLQNPVLKGESTEINELAEQHTRPENTMLQMVLKHQLVIEELLEENKKLRQIMVEDLKISPSKLQGGSYSSIYTSPCAECFECRRKQRKR